jgi:hypothetical protein
VQAAIDTTTNLDPTGAYTPPSAPNVPGSVAGALFGAKPTYVESHPQETTVSATTKPPGRQGNDVTGAPQSGDTGIERGEAGGANDKAAPAQWTGSGDSDSGQSVPGADGVRRVGNSYTGSGPAPAPGMTTEQANNYYRGQREGMEAGLIPVTTNPIEMQLLKMY